MPLIFCLCSRGTQTIDLRVKEGGPLPFSFDILTQAFQYGNRAFTKYPDDIPDYFKQSFPEGYSWERTMTFEGLGVCIVTCNIRLVKFKARDSCGEKRSAVFQFDKICSFLLLHHFSLCLLLTFHNHFIGLYS